MALEELATCMASFYVSCDERVDGAGSSAYLPDNKAYCCTHGAEIVRMLSWSCCAFEWCFDIMGHEKG